ncbi:MAG: hypothetical protein QM426_09730 [Euryarchaeota archaeon]|nr:hypothetical protein [Euryarchaeota archaeon]
MTTDLPQISAKKQHFSCYRFWKTIRKLALIVSVEALGMEIESISMKEKGRKIREIPKIHV